MVNRWRGTIRLAGRQPARVGRAHAGDRVGRDLRDHGVASRGRGAGGAGTERHARDGGGVARAVGPGQATVRPLSPVAAGNAHGQPRSIVHGRHAGHRSHRGAASQIAPARGGHRRRLGSHRAHHRHPLGHVARTRARPGAEPRHALDGGGPRVPRGHHRRAGVRGEAAVAPGALERRRRLVARAVLPHLCDAGAHALLRGDRADGAHDARGGDRPARVPPTWRWRC